MADKRANQDYPEIEREEGREQAPVGVNYTIVAVVIAASALSLAAVFGLSWWLMQSIIGVDETLVPAGVAMEDLEQIPPEPRVTDDQPGQLLRLRAMEDESLTTYGWVDREAGIARIPIDRAIDLLAERWEDPENGPEPPDAGEEPPNTERRRAP